MFGVEPHNGAQLPVRFRQHQPVRASLELPSQVLEEVALLAREARFRQSEDLHQALRRQLGRRVALRVQRVGGDADPGRDAADADAVRAQLGEQRQRVVGYSG